MVSFALFEDRSRAGNSINALTARQGDRNNPVRPEMSARIQRGYDQHKSALFSLAFHGPSAGRTGFLPCSFYARS